MDPPRNMDQKLGKLRSGGIDRRKGYHMLAIRLQSMQKQIAVMQEIPAAIGNQKNRPA